MDFGGSSPLVIDIHKTKVIDKKKKKASTFSTVFKLINQDDELVIDTGAKYGDDDHEDGKEFDYKFDEDGDKYGAGTAFLKADDST